MAGVLGASRSAYYSWARNGVSRRRAQADAELLPLVREIVTRHHRRYGSPRVRAELRSLHGKRASGKRAARLMRENSLNARGRKRFIRTTDSRHWFEASENILNCDFYARKGGRKWVSDTTSST